MSQLTTVSLSCEPVSAKTYLQYSIRKFFSGNTQINLLPIQEINNESVKNSKLNHFLSDEGGKMASIDRHQYSEDIRKGAAKFIDNLNLGTSFL